ncbi:CBS domain-containing protein [Candidatus Saccharibacteria bacterium]|nr:CBS domain-containing protein [Candidatus Saccharibacteria bacterium]
MTTFIFGIITACCAIGFAVLYAAFSGVAPKELKRRARGGDEIAGILYRTVSYGLSSKLLLGALTVISAYVSLALLIKAVGAWLAVPFLMVLSVLGLMLVRDNGGSSKVATWLAVKASPKLSWLLERLHPLFIVMARVAKRFFPVHVHSGIYEKSDIVDLLQQQRSQSDNRIPLGEIDLLSHALVFGDKSVLDTQTPKRVVQSVSADDAVGPVLMGELHKSGHSRFPVYDTKKDNIVGVLYLHDLVATSNQGKVRDIMRRKMTYVHEDFSLYQTLQAFLKTKQHLFIVVNGFEEYVGIITIEDVLEQIIGKPIVDEFDRYDDLRAVAAAAARKEHLATEKSHATATSP